MDHLKMAYDEVHKLSSAEANELGLTVLREMDILGPPMPFPPGGPPPGSLHIKDMPL